MRTQRIVGICLVGALVQIAAPLAAQEVDPEIRPLNAPEEAETELEPTTQQDASESHMASFLARETTFGVKAGLAYPGCTYADDIGSGECEDSDVNWSFGGFLDYQLSPKLVGGLYLDITGASGTYNDGDVLFEFGLGLKAQIAKETSSIAWRPGFSLGYGTGINVGSETSQNLTVKALLEAVFPQKAGKAWLGEIALWASPAGGNDLTDFTWGPGVQLRGGYIF